MEKVSVIIPVYNVESFLRQCIDSVVNQTYKCLEIILIDDGSTDSSGEICDKYAVTDERITVIHKENGGLSSARNAGLNIATGEYITYIDSDDYVSNDYVETLYKNLINNNADISIGNFQYVYEGKVNQEKREDIVSNLSVWNVEETLRYMLLQQKITTSVWRVLSKRIYWENVWFPVGKICEDIGTSYKIYSQAQKIVYTEQVIYFYLVRLGSIQNVGFSKKKMDELEMAIECKEYLDKKYPSLQEATTNRLISSCFHILFFMQEFKETSDEKQKLIALIKQNRKGMILGKDVNKKVRFACLSTYFGFGFTKWLYEKIGMRGKINI